MNSDIVVQLNIIAVSLAVITLLLLALVATFIVVVVLISRKYSKKLDEIIEKLNTIVDNLNRISSYASDSAGRVKDSLDNVHHIIDYVCKSTRDLSKNIRTFSGLKNIIALLLSSIVSVFRKR